MALRHTHFILKLDGSIDTYNLITCPLLDPSTQPHSQCTNRSVDFAVKLSKLLLFKPCLKVLSTSLDTTYAAITSTNEMHFLIHLSASICVQ